MAERVPERTPDPERAPRPPCPICGRPAVAAHRPFCSARCADVDLNRWLSGHYAIPVAEDEEGAEPEVPDLAPARRRDDADPA